MAAKHDIKYKKKLIYSIYIMIFVTLNLIYRTMHTKCDVRLTQILKIYIRSYLFYVRNRHLTSGMLETLWWHILDIFLFYLCLESRMICPVTFLFYRSYVMYVTNTISIDLTSYIYMSFYFIHNDVITNIPYDTVPCGL